MANRDGGLEACLMMISGCMDSTACCGSYDHAANVHDQTDCTYNGCSDPNTINFDDSPYIVNMIAMCIFKRRGCMDTEANNYDPQTNIHIARLCRYSGCTDSANPGFNPRASTSDVSDCTVMYMGCTLPAAYNFEQMYNADDGSCICPHSVAPADSGGCQHIIGCTDPAAANYASEADMDDGTCETDTRRVLPAGSVKDEEEPLRPLQSLCVVPMASNYGSAAPCEYMALGCTDSVALNHATFAQVE